MVSSSPEVLNLFRRAGSRAAELASSVGQDQLELPTPCAEWNVQQLLDHLAGSASYLSDAIAGRQPQDPVGIGPNDVGRRLEETLIAVARPGALEIVCRSPLGFDWTVGQAMAGTFMDMLVHGWDLAVATGQDATIDPDLAESCVAMFLPDMPERGRKAGLVGLAVIVPDDADAASRLLGAMGRHP